MSIHYAHSVNMGSTTYNNYVHSPINAPLSTMQYPFAMVFHKRGVLFGVMQNPPLFYSSQEPTSFTQFVNSRRVYINANAKTPLINKNKPCDSSTIIQKRRVNAIGRSYNKNNIPLAYATKNVDVNTVRNATRRTRSLGYTVPPKVRINRLYN
jgi:hypothetical protein